MIGQFLLGGAVNACGIAVVAFLLSRFVGEIYGRALLAIVLIVAGGTYVGFAVAGTTNGVWPLAETAQALVLGVVALLGLRGSPYWLAAAWAIHPLWDVLLHYFGAGRGFASESWAISCVSFDLLIAVYLVLAHRFLPAGPMRRHRSPTMVERHTLRYKPNGRK